MENACQSDLKNPGNGTFRSKPFPLEPCAFDARVIAKQSHFFPGSAPGSIHPRLVIVVRPLSEK